MKRISLSVLLFLSVIVLFGGLKVAKAEETKISRLLDEADVLNEEEEKIILQRLDAFSEKYQMDLVIHTMRNADYDNILKDTEDYFVKNGFGFVENYGKKGSGMILAMDFERRDWALESFGNMEKIAPKRIRDEMADYFLPYLSNEEMLKGYDTFIDLVEETVKAYDNGENPDYEAKADLPDGSHTVNKKDRSAKKLFISLGLSLILAAITVSVLTGQLSNVRAVNHATVYEVEGSFVLKEKADYFLYKTLSKTKKKESSYSDSGSSGGSSSGSSGKF